MSKLMRHALLPDPLVPDGTIEKAMYGVKATGHVARLRAEVRA